METPERTGTLDRERQFSTCVIVTLEVEGTHRWKDALVKEPAVGFLANVHRHVFRLECHKPVAHDDRDVEIILFKREIFRYLCEQYGTVKPGDPLDFGGMSCEQIALDVCKRFDLALCKVMEDGENGAVVHNVTAIREMAAPEWAWKPQIIVGEHQTEPGRAARSLSPGEGTVPSR